MRDDTSGAPRRLGRPRDVDSEATRKRLLDVARRRFARDGFDGTTNRAIADMADITSGAIYHYFSSKAELYEAVYVQTLDRVYHEFDLAVAGHRSLLDQFSAVLDAAARLNDDDPSLAGFVVAISTETRRHPELATRLQRYRGRNVSFFRRLVADAVERGELAPDVDPRAVEDLMGAVLAGLARFSAVTGDAKRHRAAIDALKLFFAGALVEGSDRVDEPDGSRRSDREGNRRST
jgi:AcrR family transcriptional regulator